ncbi:MAG: HD domain-containing protein [Actinobacteria bacterium]|nr:MAG: HD domain-containing protein [Actinomycetota bacterium]
MRALAEHDAMQPADVDRWGLAGLLHDLDYAETADDPARHGLVSAAELEGLIDDEMLHAILAHAEKAPMETRMDRALYAADPTTGFVVAAALIRPEKKLSAVDVDGLVRRWKEKSFAKGASREQMASCEQLGMTREEFLGVALAAMQARSDELGL